MRTAHTQRKTLMRSYVLEAVVIRTYHMYFNRDWNSLIRMFGKFLTFNSIFQIGPIVHSFKRMFTHKLLICAPALSAHFQSLLLYCSLFFGLYALHSN